MHAIFFERMLSIFYIHWFCSHSLSRSLSLSPPFSLRLLSLQDKQPALVAFLFFCILHCYCIFIWLYYLYVEIKCAHHMRIWTLHEAEKLQEKKHPTRPINGIWLSSQIKQYWAIYFQWKGGRERFFYVHSERTCCIS